jgi:hypothetical protein
LIWSSTPTLTTRSKLASGKGMAVLVALDAARRRGEGAPRVDPGDGRARQLEAAAEAAQVEHVAEVARHARQPVVDPLEHMLAHEPFVAARGAVAALAAQRTVEDLGITGTIMGHGALVRRRAAGDKAVWLCSAPPSRRCTGSPISRCRRAARAAARSPRRTTVSARLLDEPALPRAALVRRLPSALRL